MALMPCVISILHVISMSRVIVMSRLTEIVNSVEVNQKACVACCDWFDDKTKVFFFFDRFVECHLQMSMRIILLVRILCMFIRVSF